MLTKEILKSNAALTGLTDDQVNAIAELSKNDENTVIASKTREIWDSVDTDIQAVTGEAKPTGVKSYDHLKSTLTTFKTKASNATTLQTELDTLKVDKANLEKAIKDGNTDGALKTKVSQLEQQIVDKEGTITSLRNDLTTKESEYQKGLTAEAAKNVDLRFETAFAKSLAGVKFKSGIPQSAIDATVNAAKAATKAKGTPEFQSNDDGSESIVFRDDKNMLITNPENLQKPFTGAEIFKSQLGDIIDGGKKQPGGGGGPSDGGGGDTTVLDFSNVSNRVEADRAIRGHLTENNVSPGSKDFNDQYQQLYTDNNVGELPMK